MPAPLVIATANLDRKIPWGPRKSGLVRAFRSLAPDILCLQESAEYERDLAPALGMRQVADHVNCPILAVPRFDRLEQADLEVQGYGRKRYGSGALLDDAGTRFAVVSFHPSNTGEYPSAGRAINGRIKQAESLWSQLEDLGWADVPLMIFGDMNDRGFYPDGIPGVFVGKGLTDFLSAAKMPGRIDRGFGDGFGVLGGYWLDYSKRLSDHGGAAVFRVQAGLVPQPGPVSIANLVTAWQTGSLNNESLVWQTWLSRLGHYSLRIDGRIGPKTKAATYAARRRYFPNWSEEDITSEPGRKTVERIRDAAKSPREVVD